MNLIQSNVSRMSSEDLFYVICESRGMAGESRPRYNDFTARLVDELEGEYYESFVVRNPNNTKTTHYWLNNEQCVLVGLRESKSVRKQVIKKLKELEAKQEAETPEQLMARALISAQSVIASKDAQIEAAQPAIRLESAISNDAGTMSMTEAGKGLQVKPRMFINWLYEHKYIDSSNMPYQRWINQGLLVISTIEKNGKPRSSTRVTGKGFAYFGGKVSEVKFANKQHYLFYK